MSKEKRNQGDGSSIPSFSINSNMIDNLTTTYPSIDDVKEKEDKNGQVAQTIVKERNNKQAEIGRSQRQAENAGPNTPDLDAEVLSKEERERNEKIRKRLEEKNEEARKRINARGDEFRKEKFNQKQNPERDLQRAEDKPIEFTKREDSSRQDDSQMEFSEEATSFLGENNRKPAKIKDLSTGEVRKITSNPFLIGKSQSCDLVVQSNYVSRHHAEILRSSDKYFIKDLNSTNGTFVESFKLPAETEIELKNEQTIIFANKKFKFHV